MNPVVLLGRYAYDNPPDSAAPSDFTSILAHYEYDPFGTVITNWGTESTNNHFRFSTKYWDDETGLGYWGYRDYSPELGRWISRDPIGDESFFSAYTDGKDDREYRRLREGHALNVDQEVKASPAEVHRDFRDPDVFSVTFVGHGTPRSKGDIWFSDGSLQGPVGMSPHHRLGGLKLAVCYGGAKDWRALVSEYGWYWAKSGLVWIWDMYSISVGYPY